MPAASNKARTYAAAHFALELDGNKNVGFCRSIEGGGIKAEIVTQQYGGEHRQWKQLSKPEYEDVKLQVGMSMSPPFYDWISGFFEGKVERRDGAIVAGDFHYNERARREMYHMLISEVTLPALDGEDKNACFMTIGIAPERVEFKKGTNNKLNPGPMQKQKLWTPANFQFKVDGFEQECRRVTKVDSFTIKQQILDYPQGGQRDKLRVPGFLEFPNITFYVPESDSQKFFDHYKKHVLDGKPQAEPRLTGEIEFRDQDGSGLCSIALAGVDLASVQPAKMTATSDDVKTVKIEISVESMVFSYVGASTES
jgi:hypothetical protein